MKRNSTILALVIGLTFISLACSKTGVATNMSDDDKHKLFQAVAISGDAALIIEAAQKIGLADSSGNPTPAMQQFTKDHTAWAMKNTTWVMEYRDQAKAKEYAKSHMP